MAVPDTEFSWDEHKSQECSVKRGFGFSFAARLWESKVIEREDQRRDYGEIRLQALGKIDGFYFVVVFTWRDGRRHIISARRAHRKEVARWVA